LKRRSRQEYEAHRPRLVHCVGMRRYAPGRGRR
jgi:hypothetical protein